MATYTSIVALINPRQLAVASTFMVFQRPSCNIDDILPSLRMPAWTFRNEQLTQFPIGDQVRMANGMEAHALDDALLGLLPTTEDASGLEISDGTSSASESSVELTPPPYKKHRPGRKPIPIARRVVRREVTYYKRKDEIEELRDQVQQLQARLGVIERKGQPSQEQMDAVGEAVGLNAALNGGLEHHNLLMAGTQSMLSRYNQSVASASTSNPLNAYIHLPKDLTRRAELLDSMRGAKLQIAFRFMAERTRYLDLSRGHRQGESFDLPNGELSVVGFDVIHFRGGYSLQQVYEAFKAFVTNQEISVSERLGILTVRESEEAEEFKFGQNRFLSSIPEGLEIESNVVVFSKFVEPTPTSPGFAIGTIDFVDQDDLYPYRPEECGRKETTGAVMFTEVSTASGSVVAMTRWSSALFRPPTSPLSTMVEAAVRERILPWCDVMPKAMQEWLATQRPMR